MNTDVFLVDASRKHVLLVLQIHGKFYWKYGQIAILWTLCFGAAGIHGMCWKESEKRFGSVGWEIWAQSLDDSCHPQLHSTLVITVLYVASNVETTACDNAPCILFSHLLSLHFEVVYVLLINTIKLFSCCNTLGWKLNDHTLINFGEMLLYH